MAKTTRKNTIRKRTPKKKSGFILTKKLRSGVFIEAYSGSLDDPKLYIEKKNSSECFILQLTREDILELLN